MQIERAFFVVYAPKGFKYGLLRKVAIFVSPNNLY